MYKAIHFFKKKFVAVLLLTINYSCKKETDAVITYKNMDESSSADAPNCTGKTWTQTQHFPFRINGSFDRFNLVYQNKMYMPCYSTQKVYIHYGSIF